MTGHPNMGWMSGLRERWKFEYIDINPLDNFDIFKPFDLIFLYLISGYKPKISWNKQAQVLKETFPNKPLMIFFDMEATKNPDGDWRDTFRAADLIMHCSPLDKLGAWQEYKSKCFFSPIPVNPNGIYRYRPKIDQKWSKNRPKWIGLMHHTSPYADLAPAFDQLSHISSPVRIFTGWHGIDEKHCKALQKLLSKLRGIHHVEAFPRLEPQAYFEKIADCYLMYENCGNYIGWSRFTYEAAVYDIPTVSNMNIAANRIANMELCSENPEQHIPLINKLLGNVAIRNKYGRQACETLISYCDVNRVNNELAKRLIELGLKI